MKKVKTIFECVECGYESVKFFGRCPSCDTWNTMIEKSKEAKKEKHEIKVQALSLADIGKEEVKRESSGISELDRVLGGGIVKGSAILIGGEPGVGKSTMLLKIAGSLGSSGNQVLYYSGEESATQIKMRSQRLEVSGDNISILSMGCLEDLKATIEVKPPKYLIVDSIQTLNSNRGMQISGSVSALRYVTSELIEICKSRDISLFVVGHITKDGAIAGPKTLEHMVDVVLYFSGEMMTDLRMLRAEKNRFGSVNELGVFQMTAKGLAEVKDPSVIFLQHRSGDESGVAVFPAMQGMRAIMLEIQVLVTESPFTGNPRRTSIGFDHQRLSMLISVIEKKLKLPFYKSDVFLNVTGGFSLKDTAADLPVIAALLSSYKNFSLPNDAVFLGEIGLTGEIRPVSYVDSRLREASKHGFSTLYMPKIQNQSVLKKGVVKVETLFHFFNKLKS